MKGETIKSNITVGYRRTQQTCTVLSIKLAALALVEHDNPNSSGIYILLSAHRTLIKIVRKTNPWKLGQYLYRACSLTTRETGNQKQPQKTWKKFSNIEK